MILIKVFINSDETVLEICAKLENEKIVPNGDLACQLLIYYGRDRMIHQVIYCSEWFKYD